MFFSVHYLLRVLFVVCMFAAIGLRGAGPFVVDEPAQRPMKRSTSRPKKIGKCVVAGCRQDAPRNCPNMKCGHHCNCDDDNREMRDRIHRHRGNNRGAPGIQSTALHRQLYKEALKRVVLVLSRPEAGSVCKWFRKSKYELIATLNRCLLSYYNEEEVSNTDATVMHLLWSSTKEADEWMKTTLDMYSKLISRDRLHLQKLEPDDETLCEVWRSVDIDFDFEEDLRRKDAGQCNPSTSSSAAMTVDNPEQKEPTPTTNVQVATTGPCADDLGDEEMAVLIETAPKRRHEKDVKLNVTHSIVQPETAQASPADSSISVELPPVSKMNLRPTHNDGKETSHYQRHHPPWETQAQTLLTKAMYRPFPFELGRRVVDAFLRQRYLDAKLHAAEQVRNLPWHMTDVWADVETPELIKHSNADILEEGLYLRYRLKHWIPQDDKTMALFREDRADAKWVSAFHATSMYSVGSIIRRGLMMPTRPGLSENDKGIFCFQPLRLDRFTRLLGYAMYSKIGGSFWVAPYFRLVVDQWHGKLACNRALQWRVRPNENNFHLDAVYFHVVHEEMRQAGLAVARNFDQWHPDYEVTDDVA
jgi:hypothetical protein